MEFTPRGFTLRDHVHPEQEERHEVVEGSLGIVVAGRTRTLAAGDVEAVPPATPHPVFPVGDGRVRVHFELRPALETEVLIETYFGLARDGRLNDRGDLPLLQLAVIVDDLAHLGHPTRPPRAVQRALFAPLAALARRRGYRSRYERYSGSEEAASRS